MKRKILRKPLGNPDAKIAIDSDPDARIIQDQSVRQGKRRQIHR